MGKSQAKIVSFPTGGLSIECPDLSVTTELANFLAKNLRSGDIILLKGALAAGKTTFVSLVCGALNCFDKPSSPTYVISNSYACPKFEIFHIDAYRLKGLDEFQNLGLEEFFPDAVTFIEWGERVSPAFSCYLKIEIDFLGSGDEGRTYRLTAAGSRWRSFIGGLATHPSPDFVT